MDILTELKQAWVNARQGRGRFIHLLGDVGAGKSTLLARFLEESLDAEQQGAVVEFRCGDSSQVRSSEFGEVEDLVARIAEGVRVIDWVEDDDDRGVQWMLPGADFLAAASCITTLPGGSNGSEGPSPADIYAGLLMDICRNQPVLLILDDVHRTDEPSRRLLESMARLLQEDSAVRLLVIAAATNRLGKMIDPLWEPDPGAVLNLPPLSSNENQEVARRGLSARDTDDSALVDAIVDVAAGNPLVAHSLGKLVSRGDHGEIGEHPLTHLQALPEFAGLAALAQGNWREMSVELMADLQSASVVGSRFKTAEVAGLWSTPEEDAIIRIDGLVATGYVVSEGDGWAFLSDELAAQCADLMAPEDRNVTHARIAEILRFSSGVDDRRLEEAGDVTDTWSNTRNLDRDLRIESESLWAAARHFAAAGRHDRAAEAAVHCADRLLKCSGGQPFLAGRLGSREHRERRHKIYAALTEASGQLESAESIFAGQALDEALVEIRVRLLNVRSRFKVVMGDFAEARRTADLAMDLSRLLSSSEVRISAQMTQLEVYFASGDINSARAALGKVFKDLECIEAEHAVPAYRLLAEVIGRWEWSGLHSRLYPFIFERLRAMNAHQESIRVSLAWLHSMAQSSDHAAVDALAEQILEDASLIGEEAFLAEQLARNAADLIQARIEMHYDLLSGEFYLPDLNGTTQPLGESLAIPVHLLTLAEHLAASTGQKLTELRVARIMLWVVYETRERLAELLNHWLPVHEDEVPVRLSEIVDLLNNTFFGVDQVEAVTEKVIVLAGELGLEQVMGDTIYGALDRHLPGAVQRAGTLFEMAREAYNHVGDAYGVITLHLIETRHFAQTGQDPDAVVEAGLQALEETGDQLSADQLAFVHLQFGELLLNFDERFDEAVSHLERAMHLYDRVGDIEHLQVVGAILREVYRKQGDFGRYRWIRERFRAVDEAAPGIDPLGLELKIEQQLSMARQESDDERAIEMVERCVQLFGRMPDGTTRIDECFVEISKICRRRADEAESEQSFQAWLERSLDAVRVAASINRSLGNYFRLFEEIHELFDDLIGLGMYDEYLRVRAENRELAFAVGNVSELLYLFEEHLQYDAETGTTVVRLSEVRGFYEALIRYLLGLGAKDYAVSVQHSFVGFLTAVGEVELADDYRQRTL